MELKIGAVISEARRQKGLTQEALADAVGVSGAAVSKWETGASYPDITLLSPIARALGLTVDALLDFRPCPSPDEIHTLSKQLGKVFDTQGYEAGQAACEAALREYPSSSDVKITVGGLYYRYLASALEKAPNADDTLRAIMERTLALFEEGEATCEKPAGALVVRHLRASTLIMCGEYDRAEALMESLPRPQYDPDQLYNTLYLARGDLEKAESASRKTLLTHVTAAGVALMNLSSVARRRQDPETECKMLDACRALYELFELDNTTVYQLHIAAALAAGDRQAALEFCEKWVDALLARTFDYSANPFFAGLQLRVPSANELAVMNRLSLRLMEEDELFAPLLHEPRFEAARSRLKAAVQT